MQCGGQVVLAECNQRQHSLNNERSRGVCTLGSAAGAGAGGGGGRGVDAGDPTTVAEDACSLTSR